MSASAIPLEAAPLASLPGDSASACRVGVAIAVLIGLAILAQRGLPGAAALAGLTCLAAPLLAGTRPRPWLIPSRKSWTSAITVAVLAFLLPTLALLAVLRLQLGALVLHPRPLDALGFVGSRFALALPMAFAEEFFFRGWLLQTALPKRARPLPLSAALFAACHIVVTGQVMPGPAWLGSGLFLGWLTRRSGGVLWPAILVHAAFNAAAEWSRLLVSMNLPLLHV